MQFFLLCFVVLHIQPRPGLEQSRPEHTPTHTHAHAYARPRLPARPALARELARATSERLARANFSRACDLARASRIPLARAKKKPGLMSGPLSRVSVARVNSRACQIIRNTAVYVERNATISSQKFQVRSPVIKQHIVQNTRYAGRIHQSPGELKTM